MGTPRERDAQSDAAEDHLIAEGGHFARSPRAFTCGRYEGEEGIILHLRRRCDEGTYFHIDLEIGGKDICHAVLDMTYPYGLAKSVEKHASYENIWRETNIDQKSGCRTWMGFGYTADSDKDYVDCAEHIFPVSVGYGYHSGECAKNCSGEWNWCSGESSCGKKVWMLELSVFDTTEGCLDQEKLSVTLTYVLLKKDIEGRQKTEILVAVNGVIKGSVVSKDKRDAKLGNYDKNLLKRSAALFVSSRRHLARKPHPPHIPAYLSQVYEAPEEFEGNPRTQGEEDQQEAILRCLLQLLNRCEAFNLSLLMRVLYDQLGDEATQWPFISEMNTLLNGQRGSVANILRHLSAVPRVKALQNLPDILILLLRLLTSVQHTIESGKWEKEIRCFSEKLFHMWTTWITVVPCRICDQSSAPTTSRHLPNTVLQCNESGVPLNVEESLKRWTEDRNKKLGDCDRNLRCRYLFVDYVWKQWQ